MTFYNSAKTERLSFLNCTFVAVVLLWQALQLFVAFDGAGRIPRMLTIIVLLTNVTKKHTFSTQMNIWAAWLVYNILDYLIHGYHVDVDAYIFIMDIISTGTAMYVVSIEFVKNEKRIIRVLFWCFVLYGVAGLSDLTINTYNNRALSTFGNQLPNRMVLLVFLAMLRKHFQDISYFWLLFVLIMALSIIVFSATRKAFAASLIIILFYLIPSINFKSVKSIFVILLLVVGYYLVSYLMDNTFLGERFSSETEYGQSLVTNDNIFFRLLSDRADQYILGWRLFKEHILTGVGLGNFRYHTQYAYQLHTEYIVQLAECGLIGSTLFIAFWYTLTKSVVKYIKKISAGLGFLFLGLIAAILEMCFTGWIYNFPFYFTAVGIVIGAIQKQSQYK